MAGMTFLSEKHIADVEEAQKLGLTMELTAGYLGIGTTTLYRWMSRGEAEKGTPYRRFWEAFKRGEAKGAAMSLARIQKAANGGQWQADAWLLERRHGYRRDAPPPREEKSSSSAPLDDALAAAQRTGLLDAEGSEE